MKSLGLVGVLALLGTGCYREYGPGPVQPMGNIQPDPVAVAGPPGGAVDPGYAYDQPQDPNLPGYPAGYPEGYPAGTETGGEPAPADPYVPQASGGAGDQMGMVNDAQIDATLAPYGEWLDSDEYGRVWRPYATVVGQSFTPYETCGSWVWTDYGWTYTCDWDWGWLPFHYGQWDWFDGGWCWVPDYTWGPGWVDWRYGGGYVGWRPQRPRDRGSIIRDHRGNGKVYVPKSSRESHWRFISENGLGRGRHHGSLVGSNIGLSATSPVARPPVRGQRTVSAASLFSSRRNDSGARVSGSRGQNFDRNPYPRTFDNRQVPRGMDTRYPSRNTYRPDSRGTYQPSYDPRRPTRVEPNRGYNPRASGGYQNYNPRPSGSYQPSRGYNPRPSGGSYNPPSRPSNGGYRPAPSSSGGSYRPAPSSSPSRSSSSGSSYSRPSSSSSSSRGSSSSSSGSSSRGSSSSSSSGGSRGRR